MVCLEREWGGGVVGEVGVQDSGVQGSGLGVKVEGSEILATELTAPA